MKTSTYFLVGLLGFSSALALPPPAEQQKRVPNVEVQFFEPTKFTDVKDSYMGDYQRTTYLDSLRDYVIEQSKYYVPAGWQLVVTFTDIDMAGDFEPWRGPRFDDIRIVKDIYPPRINLSFQLVDAEGHVVKEGKRELKDLAFMMKINMSFRDDPVRHEKALLDDWFRAEFPRVKKSS
jgi:hypothetical protein